MKILRWFLYAFTAGLLVGIASAQTTPNLHFNVPPIGSYNWGPGVNANMTMLDSYLSGVTSLPSLFWQSGVTLAPCKPSGVGHGGGFLPDAGATTGNTRYLREDCTWADPGGGSISSIQGAAPITATTAAGVSTIGVTGVTDRYNIGGLIYAYSNGVLQSAGNPYSASITSCSQCNATYEAGFTTTNPMTFGFGYTYGTTASATLGDGTNTVTLTTPFTSGSLPYSYCTVGQGVSAFTFTLSATSTSPVQTSNPTAGVNCLPRSYVGTGTGGSATGVTVSGTSAALVGATGTLTDGGLETSNVGQTFTVTTSGTQYVYLLLVSNVNNPTGGSFTTPGPTVFQMNAPTTITVAGQYGGTWTGYLYRSVNSFVSGTTNPILVGN